MDVISKWGRLLLGNPQLVILVLTLVLGFGAILWIGNLVAPIIASVIIAYLLDGFANPLMRIRIPRFIGVLVVYLGFLALLAFIVFAIVPILSQQATQLVSQIPGIFTELRDALMQLPHRYPEFISESQVNQIAGAIGYEAMALGRGMLTASVSSVFGVITLGIYVVLMPLLVFFMLKDKERLIAWVIGFLPRDHRLLAHVWEDVHRQLGNYVRGKIIEIVVVWVATYFTFAVFGLDFAVLLSFLVGISVLIPYVGAIAVTIPVAMIAYVQWGIGPDFTYSDARLPGGAGARRKRARPAPVLGGGEHAPDRDHRLGPGVRRAVGVLGGLLRHSDRHPHPVCPPRVAAPRADHRRDVVSGGTAGETPSTSRASRTWRRRRGGSPRRCAAPRW